MARKPKKIVPAPEETTNVEPVVSAPADPSSGAAGSVDAGGLPPASPPVGEGQAPAPEPQQEQVTQAPEPAQPDTPADITAEEMPDFEPGQNYERAKLIAFR